MKNNPKRRKSKYNPYKLEKSNKEGKYKLKFKDSNNKQFNIEISEEIFIEFDRFELEDISQMNEYDRHIEHSQLIESTLHNRVKEKELNVEDLVISKLEKGKIHNAISRLPEIQRRRIILYFFKDLKLREISKKEHTSIRAIQYSINIALKNLKKFLE